MLDFQLARCVSPTLDLSYFIYSCTDKSFHNQYFDDALKFYHSELSNAIKSLGSSPEKIYPWKLFMTEVMCISRDSLLIKVHYYNMSGSVPQLPKTKRQNFSIANFCTA